jgi:predicted dehydrogenase
LVVDGAIGTPRHFSGHFFTDYAVNTAVPFTWRYQRSLAGSGALGDVGSHILDLARYLVGDIASVSGATLATFVHERPIPAAHVTGHSIGPTTGDTGIVDTDDSGAFTCQFASGAVGDIRFSRVAPGHRGPGFDLIGSEGAISFDMRRPGEFTICSAQAGDNAVSGFRGVAADPRYPYGSQLVAPIGVDYADTYVAQAYEFLSAVAEQRPYHPGFEDGVAIAEVCEAVQHLADPAKGLALEHVKA